MKIPATVITGFLGSGKTTLIRHLLGTANGTRIALVINEFGDLGIDAEVLKGCGIEGCTEDDVVELANGCICCTVADDFIPTITALIDLGYVLTLEESFAIKDRIADLLKETEESVKTGRYIMVKKNSE